MSLHYDSCFCGESRTTLTPVPFSDVPGVVLHGIEATTCPNGHVSIGYERTGDMIAAIASGVLQKTDAMTPSELRFLREVLEFEPSEMAEYFGVTAATYRAWERGKRKLPVLADRLVRLLVLYYSDLALHLDMSEVRNTSGEPREIQLELQFDDSGWARQDAEGRASEVERLRAALRHARERLRRVEEALTHSEKTDQERRAWRLPARSLLATLDAAGKQKHSSQLPTTQTGHVPKTRFTLDTQNIEPNAEQAQTHVRGALLPRESGDDD